MALTLHMKLEWGDWYVADVGKTPLSEGKDVERRVSAEHPIANSYWAQRGRAACRAASLALGDRTIQRSSVRGSPRRRGSER